MKNYLNILLKSSALIGICILCSSFNNRSYVSCADGSARCPIGMICCEMQEMPYCSSIENFGLYVMPTTCYEIECPVGLTCSHNPYGEIICTENSGTGGGGEIGGGGNTPDPCKDVVCIPGLYCEEGICISPNSRQATSGFSAPIQACFDYLSNLINR